MMTFEDHVLISALLESHSALLNLTLDFATHYVKNAGPGDYKEIFADMEVATEKAQIAFAAFLDSAAGYIKKIE